MLCGCSEFVPHSRRLHIPVRWISTLMLVMRPSTFFVFSSLHISPSLLLSSFLLPLFCSLPRPPDQNNKETDLSKLLLVRHIGAAVYGASCLLFFSKNFLFLLQRWWRFDHSCVHNQLIEVGRKRRIFLHDCYRELCLKDLIRTNFASICFSNGTVDILRHRNFVSVFSSLSMEGVTPPLWAELKWPMRRERSSRRLLSVAMPRVKPSLRKEKKAQERWREMNEIDRSTFVCDNCILQREEL